MLHYVVVISNGTKLSIVLIVVLLHGRCLECMHKIDVVIALIFHLRCQIDYK